MARHERIALRGKPTTPSPAADSGLLLQKPLAERDILV